MTILIIVTNVLHYIQVANVSNRYSSGYMIGGVRVKNWTAYKRSCLLYPCLSRFWVTIRTSFESFRLFQKIKNDF